MFLNSKNYPCKEFNTYSYMDKEAKQKYLEKNSIYFIENTLFNSLSVEEISDFVSPLHKEYKILDKEIKSEIKKIQNKYKNLDELEKYFIELLVKLENWWDRLEELEDTLKAFNTHLYTRLPSNKSYNKEFKKININDIPITQVIWKYIKLPDNLNRNIKCPLHNERTWSFKIYKDTNSFYCFWCWKGWGSINFISEIENISTKEAFKRFIEMFNL